MRENVIKIEYAFQEHVKLQVEFSPHYAAAISWLENDNAGWMIM